MKTNTRIVAFSVMALVLALVLLLAPNAPIAQAANVMIDHFTTAQLTLDFPAPTTGVVTNVVASSGGLGGSRKMVLNVFGGTGGGSADIGGSVPSAFSVSGGVATTAEGRLIYDNDTNPLIINYNGLTGASRDLTGGGTNNVIGLKILNADHLSAPVTVRLYQSATQCSQMTKIVPKIVTYPSDIPMALLFPMVLDATHFVIGTGCSSNITSFSDVGAVEIIANDANASPVQQLQFVLDIVDAGQADFGDLPTTASGIAKSYTTPAIVTGGIAGGHFIDNLNTWVLGSSIDGELDGQPSSDARGDDKNPSLAQNDENGVVWDTDNWAAGSTHRITVTVSGSISGCLAAWIDFNNNGKFTNWSPTDPNGAPYPAPDGEKVINNFAIPSAGQYAFDITVPDSSVVGTRTEFFSRFRLFERAANGTCPAADTTDGTTATTITQPQYQAFGGEVEDFLLGGTPTAVSLNSMTAQSDSFPVLPVAGGVAVVGLVGVAGMFVYRKRRK